MFRAARKRLLSERGTKLAHPPPPTMAATIELPPREVTTLADISVLRTDDSETSLSSYASGGALLVFVFRGSWCAFYLRRLDDYRDRAARFERVGVRIVAMSSDDPTMSRRMETLIKLPFDVLCDPEATLISAWGLRNPRERRTAFPATFLLDESRTVRFASIDEGYAAASVDNVLQRCAQIVRNEKRGPQPALVFRLPGVSWMLRGAANEVRMLLRGRTRWLPN